MRIGDFFKRVKEDNEFRFDFIIGIWSAIIIIAIVLAVVFVSMFLLRGDKNKDEDVSQPVSTPEISEDVEDGKNQR